MVAAMRRLLIALAISFLAIGCGSEDDPEHGTVHVQVTAAPPQTATVGTAFDVSWQVHNMTHDDLHHSEIRVCEGDTVTDCGLGAQGTFRSVTGSMADGTFTASVTLDPAGTYTVVAWAHVGEDPHISDVFTVDAE